MKTPHRQRIQTAVAILSEMIKSLGNIDRAKAVELLKSTYQARRIQPIRGKTQPQDLYDKEMATLYVVGKYGLRLDQEYPELFEKVFYLEQSLEEALEKILGNDVAGAREMLKNLSPMGVIESNIVARMLRIPLTKYILGFIDEDEFRIVLSKTLEAIPEEEKTVKNYVRFYIGLKIAESIYKGEIRTREEKEALKKALSIRIGFPRISPRDDYIFVIAKSVYGLPDKMLRNILRVEQETKRDNESKSNQ